MGADERGRPGRPVVTSHAEIEEAAFALFAERGFEGTTLDQIADRVGVGRRTLFRYFRSKNDIPWGEFDRTLAGFRTLLDAVPAELGVREAVRRGVLAFNEFPPGANPSHRERMRLILQTPALQAHSAIRYAEWRRVVSEFVARRVGVDVDHVLPQVAGHLSLAVALTAYDQWLLQPDLALSPLLAEVFDQADMYWQT